MLTDFLHVNFDLKSAIYYPYKKPNNENERLYINKHSNHLLSIINQIPSMISNRISENSCDKITSTKQLLITTLFLKIVDLMITSHIFQVNPSIKLKRDKLFGSIPHIVLMWKLTLVNFLWDLLKNIYAVTINVISYSIERRSN